MRKVFYFLFLLLSVNGYGQQLLFEKTYGYLVSKSIIQGMDTTENGGYICVAAQKFNNYVDVTFPGVFLKLNANGDTTWMKSMQNQVQPIDISPAKFIDKNKGYFLTANWDRTNNLYDTSLLNITFLKYDGTIKWSKRFHIKDYDRTGSLTKSLIQLSDNRLLYFGAAVNSISTLPGNGHKFTVQVIDTSGNEIVDKVYLTGDWVYTLEKPANVSKYGVGNYVLYGSGGSTGFDKPYTIKIKPNLDTIATKTLYPSPSNTEVFSPKNGNLIYTKDNSFVFSGSWNKGFPTDRSILMKTDTSGSPKWIVRMGPPNTNTNRIFELTNDTILLVTPETGSNNIWLFKITGNGQMVDSIVLISQYTLGEMRGAVLKWDGSLTLCGQANNTAWLAHITNAGRIKPICEVPGYGAKAMFSTIQIKDTLKLTSLPNQTSITGYIWQIGTTVSALPNPKVIISVQDSISISLKVTNSLNCIDSTYKKVWVKVAKSCIGISGIAKFTYQVFKDTLFVNSQSTGNILYHQWRIGNTNVNDAPFVKYLLKPEDRQKDTISIRLIVAYPQSCNDTLYSLIRLSLLNVSQFNNANHVINVYPNPANEELTLETTQNGTFYLYDLQGSMVLKVKLENDLEKINISNLNQGMYLFRFETKNINEYGKLMRH